MPIFGTGATGGSGGVTDTIRGFLASWAAVLKTRIQILSLEIEEQREWMLLLILFAIAAFFFIGLGVLLLTLFVVVLVWDSPAGPWVLAAFAILYLVAGVVFAVLLRQKLRQRPRIFSSTAAELEKDINALQPDEG